MALIVRLNNETASVRLYLKELIVKDYQVRQSSPLDVYSLLTPRENILTMVQDSPTIIGDASRKIVFGHVNPQVKEIN